MPWQNASTKLVKMTTRTRISFSLMGVRILVDFILEMTKLDLQLKYSEAAELTTGGSYETSRVLVFTDSSAVKNNILATAFFYFL